MIKTFLSKYFKKIIQGWKKLSKRQKLYLLFLLVFGLIIETSFYSLQKPKNIEKKASERKEKIKKVEKPSYAKGEVLIKLRDRKDTLKVKKEKRYLGINLDKQPVVFSDLDKRSLPKVLVDVDRKYKIKTIEKVFKGYESPKKELQKYKKRFSKDISQGKKKINEKEILKIDLSNIYKLTFDKKAPLDRIIKKLSLSLETEYVELNYVFKTQLIPNDPYYLDSYPNNVGNRDPNWNPTYDYQWNLKKINMERAWDITTGNENVIIAIIDTGVDCTHFELKRKCISGYNAINNNSDSMDYFGHGTHVAGIIGATTNEQISKGIAGINFSSKILPVKVLDDNGQGLMDDVADGIFYASNHGSDVLNLSLGNSAPITEIPFTLKDALDYARVNDIVIVAAAGNNNDEVQKGYWPANYKDVITVGATDENDQRTIFSNYGNIDVMAPGGSSTCAPVGQNNPNSCYNIISLKSASISASIPNSLIIGPENEKNYLRLAGTSMATPHVSALAGLIVSQFDAISDLEIKSLIEYSSKHLGTIGNENYGWGRIDAFSALNQLKNNSIPPVAEIYSPQRKEVVNKKKYSITGTATSNNFKNYKITIGIGEFPSEWQTDGLALVDNGSHPIEDNVLGVLDTSFYRNKTITIKLETSDKNGLRKQDYVLVRVTKNTLFMDDNVKVNDSQTHALTPDGIFSKNGDYYVVWNDLRNNGYSDIYFSKSIDNGKNFSKNKRLTNNIEERDAYYPIMLTKDRDIYVVFETRSDVSSDKIFIKKSSNKGIFFETVGVIDFQNNIHKNENGEFMKVHATIYKNWLYLIWQEHLGDKGNNKNIYFSKFNLNNNTIGEIKLLRSITNDSWDTAPDPSIVIDSFGTIYTAWTEQIGYYGPYKIILAKSNDDGNVFTFKEVIGDQNIENPIFPSLGIDRNNNTIYITFAAQSLTSWIRDVWVTKSNDQGENFSKPYNLTLGNWSDPSGSYYKSPIIINSLKDIFIGIRDFGKAYLIHCNEYLSICDESVSISPNRQSSSLKISLILGDLKDIFVLYDFTNENNMNMGVLSRRVSLGSSLSPTPTLPVGCIEPGYCDSSTNCGINASCQLINPRDPELGRCCQYINQPQPTSSDSCQKSCSSCDADGDGKYIPEKDSSLIWKKMDINCDGEKDITDVQWCASNCLSP